MEGERLGWVGVQGGGGGECVYTGYNKTLPGFDETDFVDTRYSPQQESPRCQMANKRERDESQAKIETREAQRLMSEVLIMVTQWRDLCGR